MGALDVCPFVPVRGVGMDECVLCARAFGQRLAEELAVPGEARTHPRGRGTRGLCADGSSGCGAPGRRGRWRLGCPVQPRPASQETKVSLGS